MPNSSCRIVAPIFSSLTVFGEEASRSEAICSVLDMTLNWHFGKKKKHWITGIQILSCWLQMAGGSQGLWWGELILQSAVLMQITQYFRGNKWLINSATVVLRTEINFNWEQLWLVPLEHFFSIAVLPHLEKSTLLKWLVKRRLK